MKIVRTEPAVEDLRELHAYVARDSEMYASGFVERIILAAERLVDHSKIGHVVPETNDENVRELLFQRYRITYRVTNDCIEMLSVIHGARDLGEFKPGPWEVG
jgi:plasmid stabilization system protein ParE